MFHVQQCFDSRCEVSAKRVFRHTHQRGAAAPLVPRGAVFCGFFSAAG
jgi:hypothetical protein